MTYSSFWFGKESDTPLPPAPIDIGNSLRFRGEQRLIRNTTSAVDGDWTISFWFKFSGPPGGVATGGDNYFFMFGTYAAPLNLYLNNNNSSSGPGVLKNAQGNFSFTQRVFDQSAWWHCVLNKTNGITQGYLNNEVGFGYNGSDLTIGGSQPLAIGAQTGSQGLDVNSFIGYMTDWYFVDGQSLPPTAFGKYDDNNKWIPIEYEGTYGNNGFHLTFQPDTITQNSDGTITVADTSGLGNNFTGTGFDINPPAMYSDHCAGYTGCLLYTSDAADE